jgi:hypothetical protein
MRPEFVLPRRMEQARPVDNTALSLKGARLPGVRRFARHQCARMAELVDAPASGAGAGNGVEVRVLFRAPFVLPYMFANVPKRPENQGFSVFSCPPAPV